MSNTENMMRALGRMMRMVAQSTAPSAEPNDVIDIAPLLAPWRAGTAEHPIEHAFGSVTSYADMPWHCTTAHTHRGETEWEPNGNTALWAQYHGRDAAHALPFRAESHNPYNTDHWMIWTDGYRYCSNMTSNVWTPDTYPQGWDGPFDKDGNLIKEAIE